jgi:hypothetical protein
MQLLPLDTLGAHEIAPQRVRFGLFLPWVSAQDGHRLVVKILHEQDQFLQDVPPLAFPLQHITDATYGDYWSGEVDIRPADRPTPASAWGTPGTYVYRYELHSPRLSGLLNGSSTPSRASSASGARRRSRSATPTTRGTRPSSSSGRRRPCATWSSTS